MTRSIPILLYHHVAPDREITPQGFEAQLQSLLDAGQRSYSLDEVVRHVRGEKELQAPGFALTFDDGYFDNWAYAFPILKRLSIQATYFLVTDKVESHPSTRPTPSTLDTRTQERDPGGFLSWTEAKAIMTSGLVTFGSHTLSHRNFVRRDPYRSIEDELRQSKDKMECELGTPCDHLAWPWGDYETAWLPLVQKVGYRSAATTLAGANSKGNNSYELKRINIRRQSVEWLQSRLRWNGSPITANAFGLFYGWDRRFKVWWNKESPYAHG